MCEPTRVVLLCLCVILGLLVLEITNNGVHIEHNYMHELLKQSILTISIR